MNAPAAQLGFDFTASSQKRLEEFRRYAVRARRVETPAARATDPISSHLAAEHITASGARGYQQAMTAAAVRSFPGCTTFELAMKTRIDRYVLARRTSECETAGTIKRGEIRTCAVTGRKATTWWPV